MGKKPPDQRQAEARSRGFGGEERQENLTELVRGDARTIVRHGEPEPARPRELDRDVDGRRARRAAGLAPSGGDDGRDGVERVVEQILQRLAEKPIVEAHPPRDVARDVHGEGRLPPRAPRDVLHPERLQVVAHVHQLVVEGLWLGQRPELFEQIPNARQLVRDLVEGARETFYRVVLHAAPKHRERGLHRVYRVGELMAEGGHGEPNGVDDGGCLGERLVLSLGGDIALKGHEVAGRAALAAHDHARPLYEERLAVGPQAGALPRLAGIRSERHGECGAGVRRVWGTLRRAGAAPEDLLDGIAAHSYERWVGPDNRRLARRAPFRRHDDVEGSGVQNRRRDIVGHGRGRLGR